MVEAAGWIDALIAGARAATALEIAAVVTGLAYVVLAIRSRRACWIAGGASSAFYIAVFARAGLPMQAVLQAGYVVLSAWGWWTWRPGGGAGDRPVSWPLVMHAAALAAVAAVTAIHLAWLAPAITPAAIGDVLGTWASVAATGLLVRRCRESWLWWIVIDVGLAALFAGQRLAFTAALYLAYAALAVLGWRAWRRAGDARA